MCEAYLFNSLFNFKVGFSIACLKLLLLILKITFLIVYMLKKKKITNSNYDETLTKSTLKFFQKKA